MCHKDKATSKAIHYKSDKPRHANATPYKRSKYKKDFREYED